jgi:hypothetical protein
MYLVTLVFTLITVVRIIPLPQPTFICEAKKISKAGNDPGYTCGEKSRLAIRT